MRRVFVDANLFIRYFTNDDPAKADRVAKLLAEAENGNIALVTTELVVAEIVWVLESGYGMGRAEIAPLIRGILATKGVEVLGGALVARAVEEYEEKNVDFVDAWIAAVMERHGITELFSFDRKHIGRLSGVVRREP